MSRAWVQHSCPTIGTKDKQALKRVLDSGYLTPGPEKEKFEKNLAMKIGVRYAIALSSGHAALHLALLALGAGPGKDVIIPTYACSALLNAVGYTGARSVPVDVDPKTFNITPDTVAHRITRKSCAVIAVHAFGLPCDISGIKQLGVPVIGDAAMAPGAPVGRKEDLTVFSFFATKMLATGQGGAVSTNKSSYARFIRDIITHDKRESYRLRWNYAMSDLEAALGNTQLDRLDSFVKRRRAIAVKYYGALKNMPGIISLPGKDYKRSGHVFFRFCIRTRKSVRSLIPAFKKMGIEVKEPVFRPIHRYLKMPGSRFPMCESFTGHILSLPIYPAMKEGEVNRVIEASRMILG